MQIPFYKVPQNKISISFTWDDNSVRHSSIIAPLFLENGFRCTFYVVPGDPKFDSSYARGYAGLQKQGFEIGSHSYSHKYMCSLSKEETEFELRESVGKILKCVNHYPLTFAFPNHDYNESLVQLARNYHLETRNTLANSIRFSIKTDTVLIKLIESINEAILNKTNLVFSGHSLVNEKEFLNKEVGGGYQPMRISLLESLLRYLKTVVPNAEIITFSQAAVREWIKKTALLQNNGWDVSGEDLEELEKYSITKDNILSLV